MLPGKKIDAAFVLFIQVLYFIFFLQLCKNKYIYQALVLSNRHFDVFKDK